MYVWGEMVPGIGVPRPRRSRRAVYEHTTLGLREFEAARLRIAQINGCLFCQDWRTERDGVKVEDGFADAVTDWRTTPRLRRPHPARRRVRRAVRRRPPRARRRLLDPDEGALLRQGDRRAVDVPGVVAGLRPAQPRARPRRRLRAAQPPVPQQTGHWSLDRIVPMSGDRGVPAARWGPGPPPPPGWPPPARAPVDLGRAAWPRAAVGRYAPGRTPVQWAPGMLGAAHKPGAMPLRPLGLGDIYDAALPHHPLQPEGHRRRRGPGHRGGDGDPDASSPPCSRCSVDFTARHQRRRSRPPRW